MTNQRANPFYDYQAIVDRPPLAWPDGKKVAVFVGLNIEHYAFGERSVGMLEAVASRDPDPINFGWRDYGARVGVWRIAELLDRLAITPSVLLNADVCDQYPRIIEVGRATSWCWVAHGKNNSMFAGPNPPQLGEDEERAYLADVFATIERSTGVRPRGWLGPLGLSQTYATARLLAELDAQYVLDWGNDDQPYRLRPGEGGLLSVPYSFELNDLPLFLRNGCDGHVFARMMSDACDQLADDAETAARVLPICVHPFVIGQPTRFKPFAQALAAIAARDDVWLTTTDAIAATFADQEQAWLA
jgi:peptidoglycan/xylan/chitin deacetylase (PgdA/CDA1 family)